MFEHLSIPQIEIVDPPKRNISQKCEQFSYRGFLVLKDEKSRKWWSRIKYPEQYRRRSSGGDTSCQEARGTLGPNILID